MKKWLVLALCVAMLIPSFAMAEGKATVVQEKVYLYGSSGPIQAEAFAEIQNTGDQPVELESGMFITYGTDGAVLTTSNTYSFYPRVIAPGESAFLTVCDYIEGVDEKDIASYELKLEGKAGEGESQYLNVVSAELVTKPWYEGSDQLDNIVHVVLENMGEEIAYPIIVSYGAYDAEDQLVYSGESFQDVGLLPGSKIEVRCRISGDGIEVIGGADKIKNIKAIACVDRYF